MSITLLLFILNNFLLLFSGLKLYFLYNKVKFKYIYTYFFQLFVIQIFVWCFCSSYSNSWSIFIIFCSLDINLKMLFHILFFKTYSSSTYKHFELNAYFLDADNYKECASNNMSVIFIFALYDIFIQPQHRKKF